MVFYLFMLLLLLGSTLVFYSLSPYYAALGLMISSLFGCVVLTSLGLTFLALLLLLIYMGGMLVVFVYSSALSADRYPMVSNLGEVVLLFLLLSFWVLFIFEDFLESSTLFNLLSPLNDLSSLSVLYDYGGAYLLVGGLALLVVLIVALVVSYGSSLLALRAL
ncbi:NADH dehydrogenase subunit 6 (mitochondrion) [Apostichopus japonicus]|uniref:NADH-ubiquinone oxidoreductase chain 6 n=1 Tax=Stichopus japonicus TaxID=307972 RepID=C3W4X8_STIJA|nr:NADH dehydrogenase subunit 6 [Apostichopus japonicus]ACM66281.1 NADH dehydrogenase subunit 6 [Apostichopus japonicus]ACP30408.1 NADH dehydrogenase subunit 6 [Apostichopus japonicus]ACQ99210.1 NADH dehydrogenase subunit 6 [Apostichopus japonicus]AJF41583.1 NADH dehydrogenase subunit 6 [Apostichopus japonicus]AZZ06322.1 NADH dehydrogenase subunit 6 [Apostichopus japonicus]